MRGGGNKLIVHEQQGLSRCRVETVAIGARGDIGCRACRSPCTGRWGREGCRARREGGCIQGTRAARECEATCVAHTKKATHADGLNRNGRALRRGHLCRDGRGGRGCGERQYGESVGARTTAESTGHKEHRVSHFSIRNIALRISRLRSFHALLLMGLRLQILTLRLLVTRGARRACCVHVGVRVGVHAGVHAGAIWVRVGLSGVSGSACRGTRRAGHAVREEVQLH